MIDMEEFLFPTISRKEARPQLLGILDQGFKSEGQRRARQHQITVQSANGTSGCTDLRVGHIACHN